MPNPLHPYDFLKSIVRLSNASLPIPVKLDQMLQSISEAFQTDRCLLLEPEKIIPNGFFYRLVLEKKPKGTPLPEAEGVGRFGGLDLCRQGGAGTKEDRQPDNGLHGRNVQTIEAGASSTSTRAAPRSRGCRRACPRSGRSAMSGYCGSITRASLAGSSIVRSPTSAA